MKKIKWNLYTIMLILLTILSVVSLTLVAIFGALYINIEKEMENLTSENIKLREQISIPVFSVDETDGTINITDGIDNNDLQLSENEISNQSESEDNTLYDENLLNQHNTSITQNNTSQYEDMDYDQILSLESKIEKNIKEKMKEMVSGEDGSPLKMLRSFFPENLIYSDNNEYVFYPVSDELKKHNLIAENFVKTDSGEMQYLTEGVVKSHKGIDVSKYQGNIDWNAVKADGVEYAFIRLGLRGYESGKIVTDEYFSQNIEGANSAGVPVGVYFFTQAVNVEEAKEEANFVIDAIQGYDIACPVVYDVEMITSGNGRANNISQEERTEICIAFCETIKQAGYTPMIYGNVKCFTKMVDMTRLEDYEKWYAFYDDYMYFPYEVSCWQYTEKGRVKGIKGDVDLNISYKLW